MTKSFKVITIFLISILTIIFTGCGNDAEPADTIITNGIVAVVDTSNTIAEAVAIKDGKILAAGSNDEVMKHKGDSTEVLDAKGNFVMPGFIESHAHLSEIGEANKIMDLSNVNNFDELVAAIANAADQVLPGQWIVGRGWHQEKWDPVPQRNVKGYPYHDQLSAATPRNPVYLWHASGHALLANKKAMELAGINDSTENPAGGVILKDEEGNLTGVFEENAADLIIDAFDQYKNELSPEELDREKITLFNLAAAECIRKGITSFHDAGSSFRDIDLLKEMVDSGKIPLRLYVMMLEDNESLREKASDYKMIGYGDNHLTVRAVKQYIDGALGSRGAWMLSPYRDDTTSYGLNVRSISELEETAQICIDNGLQMCTNAVGDRGNREILNIYRDTFMKNDGKNDLRWRVEHAQHLSKRDIPRFAKLGVIAAMQGIHCTSDAVFVKKRLGGWRAKQGAYVWRKLIDAGTVICNGTDAPVEDVDPIPCFYASVTRQLENNSTFYPEQAMTREEALRSYTINGAYAAFEENIKGSLEKGKLADIVILSNNLLTCEDWEIPNTKVLYTIVGGKIVYQAK